MPENSKIKKFRLIELEDWMEKLASVESEVLGIDTDSYLSQLLQTLLKAERARK